MKKSALRQERKGGHCVRKKRGIRLFSYVNEKKRECCQNPSIRRLCKVFNRFLEVPNIRNQGRLCSEVDIFRKACEKMKHQG